MSKCSGNMSKCSGNMSKQKLDLSVLDWTTFPWRYTAENETHAPVVAVHSQYHGGRMSSTDYADRLWELHELKTLGIKEYQMSLHRVYARDQMSCNEYLMRREPERMRKSRLEC